MISRRIVLAAPIAGLGGCTVATSIFGAAATPADIVADVSSIVTGLSNGFNIVKGSLPTAYQADIAKIAADLNLATGGLATLSTNLPATTGATVVSTIEGYINAVLAIATTPPLASLIPAPFSTALGLVSVVLPAIEAFVNQYLTPAAPVAAVSLARVRAAALAPSGLTVAQAVAQLQAIK
jgi:hypothetical protein